MSVEISHQRAKQLKILSNTNSSSQIIPTLDQLVNEQKQKVIQQFKRDLYRIDLSNEETFNLSFMQKHSQSYDLKRIISDKLNELENKTQESIKTQIKKRAIVNKTL